MLCDMQLKALQKVMHLVLIKSISDRMHSVSIFNRGKVGSVKYLTPGTVALGHRLWHLHHYFLFCELPLTFQGFLIFHVMKGVKTSVYKFLGSTHLESV